MGGRNGMVQAGSQNLVGPEAGARPTQKGEETNPPFGGAGGSQLRRACEVIAKSMYAFSYLEH